MKIELPKSFHELGLVKFKTKDPIYINLYFIDRKNKIAYF
jgi:hypothetical protein